jgi:hypothetical protein
MYFLTCWRFRRLLTRYVDGELAPAERVVVRDHLARCEACRRCVRIEGAVRQTLRDRTTRAGSTAWLPPPPLPLAAVGWGRRLRATAAGVALLVLTVALWSGYRFRTVPLLAVGVISDSHCGPVHRPVADGGSTSDCVRGCLKRGARYVFVSGNTVYTIRNQDFSALALYAGRSVELAGTARSHTVTVAQLAGVP